VFTGSSPSSENVPAATSSLALPRGLNLVIMVNVAIAIEVVFNWPGVGQLLFDGMSNRDFPMVQGIVLMSGVMIVILNFGIDILYAYVDPRIRLAK